LIFFYYAGHGAQLDWRNYLLPVDVTVKKQSDITQQCVDLNVLLGQLSAATGKTFIIVLDACRNNPFGSAYRPEQKGLSQFDAPVGSLLAYATSPGNIAADGDSVNGLYTEHLVREMGRRGTRIEDALKRVRLNVRLASQGQQIPWETTSLEGDVFLFDEGQKKFSESELEKQVEADINEWTRIKSSQKTDDWVGYLRQFPNGRFAEIAQMRLTRLLIEVEKTKPSSQSSPSSTGSPTTPSVQQQDPSVQQQIARRNAEQKALEEKQQFEKERRMLEEQQRRDEQRRNEERQRLDAIRQQEQEKLERERLRIAEAERVASDQRKFEERRLAEDQRRLELERQRASELERIALENRKKDELKIIEEQQRARAENEQREKEEQSRRERDARLKEQQRIEAELAELENKRVQEAQKLALERQHLAEQQRKEEQRRLEEQKQQDTLRRQEIERIEQERQRIAQAERIANEKRLAEEKQRREVEIQAGEKKTLTSASATPISTTAIEIRAGLPVPLLIASSANPYSSGRYPLGRKFTVGDEFGLIEYDLLTLIESPTLLRVTSVDPVADRVLLNDGIHVWDTMGNTIKSPTQRASDVPRQGAPAELYVGKKWTGGWTIDHPRFGKVTVDQAFQIIAYETVEVPAGKFKAFVVSFYGWDTAGRKTNGKSWIVPGINVSVKREIMQTGANGRGFNQTDGFKLASIRQFATEFS
jgi:uncharacterized caspase-like protein